MKKEKLKKIMGQLDKKIKANTTWNNIDVDEFTGQFGGVENNNIISLDYENMDLTYGNNKIDFCPTIDVEQFTGQFRGVEKGICLNCEKPVDQDANICHSCYFKKVMGGKQQITDIHRAEAKRLIEVFLGLKIYNAGSFYTKSEFEGIFKNAQENALKCCDDKINDLTGYDEKLSIWKHSMCDISQIQYHKGFITEEIQKIKSVKQAIKDYE